MDDDLAPWLAEQELPRIVTVAGAARLGYSPAATFRAKRSGRWRRVLPGVYLTRESLTSHDRSDAALAYAGTGAALSGPAALWTLGVARIAPTERRLVVVPMTNAAKSTSFVTVRRSPRPLIYELAPGPRCVELARAVADHCVTLRSLDDVRTLVARAVQHRHCTLQEIERNLDEGPMRGSKFLRQALAEVGLGAASAPEARAAELLRSAGITGWEPNCPLRLPDGTVRVVDFCWPRLRAVLEIDSVEWHYDVDDWTGTWDRHFDLSQFGYSVVHRPPSALRDGAAFARRVRAWLAGREADLRLGLGAQPS